MEELQKENAELKEQVKKLIEENKQLKERVAYWREQERRVVNTVIEDAARYESIIPTSICSRKIHEPILLESVKYEIKNSKPIIHVNRFTVGFESTNDRAAEAAKAIWTPSHLKKLSKDFVPAAEIYKWFKYSEPWENISVKERKQFQKDLYQWIRRLNEKLAHVLHDRKLLMVEGNAYKLNYCIRLIPPKK